MVALKSVKNPLDVAQFFARSHPEFKTCCPLRFLPPIPKSKVKNRKLFIVTSKYAI